MLLAIFLTPLIFALILPFSKKAAQSLALIGSVVPLLFLFFSDGVQENINYLWAKPLGIHFHLGMDSLSLLFLYLTFTIIPLTIFTSEENSSLFYRLVLVLQSLLIGFFTSRDLVLFIIFFEAMLLPLFFLISLFGKEGRKEAAMKFLLYMIGGSLLLVLAALSLFSAGNHSFDFNVLKEMAEKGPYAYWIASIFFLAFAVKTPLFPFHIWLPDAYYEASTSGTILLSALLSKAGIYGFLRIGREIFPTTLTLFSPYLLCFALIGVFYGAFAALRQQDYKRLIAYSSFSHVNFILAGIFIGTEISERGAILQAFNHGITIMGLFLVAGWLEERLLSTSLKRASGLTRYMPKLAWLTLFFILSSIALPGTSSFIGELMILLGIFAKSPWISAISTLTVILSAAYMLRFMQKIYFQTPFKKESHWEDISNQELFSSCLLCIFILFIGLYPAPFLELTFFGGK